MVHKSKKYPQFWADEPVEYGNDLAWIIKNESTNPELVWIKIPVDRRKLIKRFK